MFGRLYVWKANPGDGLFAWLQKFITGVAYKHTSGGVGTIYNDGREWQFEMFLCGTTTPLGATTPDLCRQWKINAPDAIVRAAFINCAVQNSGKVYGFLSLLNYIPRRIVELFGFNGRGVAFIHVGNVCSSAWLVDCIQELAVAMQWGDLFTKTLEWNRNVFHSGDMVNLLLSFPNYFTEV